MKRLLYKPDIESMLLQQQDGSWYSNKAMQAFWIHLSEIHFPPFNTVRLSDLKPMWLKMNLKLKGLYCVAYCTL